MKKSRFIICLVMFVAMIVTNLPVVTYASEPTFDGTMIEGATWGMSEDEAVLLLSKKGIEFEYSYYSLFYIDFDGFDFFPGITTEHLDLGIFNDKLTSVSFCILHNIDYEVTFIKWKKALSNLYGEYHEIDLDDVVREVLTYNAVGSYDEGNVITDEEILNYYIMERYNFICRKRKEEGREMIVWNLPDGTLVELEKDPHSDNVHVYYIAPYEIFT